MTSVSLLTLASCGCEMTLHNVNKILRHTKLSLDSSESFLSNNHILSLSVASCLLSVLWLSLPAT